MAIAHPAVDARRARRILPFIMLSLMTVVSAVSGLNVALPSLARETGATQTQLTWIVDAYTVVFAGLLLLAGAIGDRIGRKRILLGGLAVFGAAAVAGFIVDDPTHLILVRIAMGVGAAFIMPTTLSVITTSFPVEERPKAIGVWVGAAAGGAVLGVFVTAILLEFYEWNAFFALNVTLAVLAFIGTARMVPADSGARGEPLDIAGGLLSVAAVGGIVYGIIEGADRGWGDAVAVSALVVGIVAGVCFVLWELRVVHPLLDPRLFRIRGFAAGSLSVTAQFFGAFGFFFTALQYLQFVANYSPLQAAAHLLIMPFVLLPTARNAPYLARRIGFRRVGPVGLLSSAIGLGIISTLGTEMNHLVFWGGLVFFAFGMGMAGTPATTAITESLPPAKQGVASAVNDTARELGSAFGIAVLGSAISNRYSDGMADVVVGLPPEIAERVQASVAFTQSPRIAEFGELGQRLVAAAHAAFVDGTGAALATAAGVLLVASAAVALLAPAKSTGAGAEQ